MPDVLLIEESSGTRIMGRREYVILVHGTQSIFILRNISYNNYKKWSTEAKKLEIFKEYNSDRRPLFGKCAKRNGHEHL